MYSDRRKFVFGAATAGLFFYNAPCASAPQVFSAEQFGAVGDGGNDDTNALQTCLDSVPAGAVVRLRQGAVYMIDTNAQPTRGQFGGLKLRSRQILELNGAELRAIPTIESHGAVVQGFRTAGWQIKGPGRIVGERLRHAGRGGEWGMGVAAFSSSAWSIDSGVEISNCWGDGIYVGSAGPASYCEQFLIDNVRISNCRRNGISVVAGRNGNIRSVDISDINGTNPKGGVDLEPDNPLHPNRDIVISNTRIHGDLQVGIYVTVANENIVISGVDIEADNSGVLVASRLAGVRVLNSHIRSRIGGAEGAAIRAVGDPSLIRTVEIHSNRLSGGGAFVVDFFGRGFRDLSVSSNVIRANNPGVQGIARIHDGTFVNNECIIDRAAGKEGDYFVHLLATSHGRNSYRNLSPHNMYGAVLGGQRLGGDKYDPSLGKWVFDRL